MYQPQNRVIRSNSPVNCLDQITVEIYPSKTFYHSRSDSQSDRGMHAHEGTLEKINFCECGLFNLRVPHRNVRFILKTIFRDILIVIREKKKGYICNITYRTCAQTSSFQTKNNIGEISYHISKVPFTENIVRVLCINRRHGTINTYKNIKRTVLRSCQFVGKIVCI